MKGLYIGLSLLTLNAWADPEALKLDFKSLLKKYGVGTQTEQAFCYNINGKVEGYQVDKLQRIASVTKLLTTYAASENLNLNKRFLTKIYINGNQMHIEGSRDPYWEEEKMLLLMRALNQAGYKSFSKVTFDKNFIFYDQALSAHRDITPAMTRARMAAYFSAKGATFVKGMWNTTVNFAKEEGVTLERTAPSLTVPVVAQVDSNPLSGDGLIVLMHKSKPFHAILKSMNVMSKNIVAQNVFLESNRVKKFDSLMVEKGFPADTFKIYNGSGLPMTASKRLDNLATCRTVIGVIGKIEASLKKHKLQLSDVIAVNGGQDLGSFRTRFTKYPETHNAVLSKTGTLAQASSLAGTLLMDTHVPFAVLDHTTNVANARKFQDEFVARMFHHLGDAVPLDYSKISIFPWDESEFLEEAAVKWPRTSLRVM